MALSRRWRSASASARASATALVEAGHQVRAMTRHPERYTGAGEPVQAAMVALEKADAAVVVADGRPTGVLTRQDVLAFLSG